MNNRVDQVTFLFGTKDGFESGFSFREPSALPAKRLMMMRVKKRPSLRLARVKALVVRRARERTQPHPT